MPKATTEQLFRALFRGAPTTKAQSAANQFAGITTVPSGSATGTVSTSAVKSDSLILFGPQAAAAVASGFSRAFETRTISPGTFFQFGTADGVALARDTSVRWVIWQSS